MRSSAASGRARAGSSRRSGWRPRSRTRSRARRRGSAGCRPRGSPAGPRGRARATRRSDSVTTAPPSSTPRSRPTSVTSGPSALRSAWRPITTRARAGPWRARCARSPRAARRSARCGPPARSRPRPTVASVIAGSARWREPVPARRRRSRRSGTSPSGTRPRRAAPSRRRTSARSARSSSAGARRDPATARAGSRRRCRAGRRAASWSSDRGERELRGRPHPIGDDRGDRALAAVALAEVAVRDPRDPAAVLADDAAIEAVVRADPHDRLGGARAGRPARAPGRPGSRRSSANVAVTTNQTTTIVQPARRTSAPIIAAPARRRARGRATPTRSRGPRSGAAR